MKTVCADCGYNLDDHTIEECLQKRLSRMTAERDAWKDAWFNQRAATGRIALTEYARGCNESP